MRDLGNRAKSVEDGLDSICDFPWRSLRTTGSQFGSGPDIRVNRSNSSTSRDPKSNNSLLKFSLKSKNSLGKLTAL